MSSDIHIKVDTIEGDSLDEGHSGEIEALSLSHGMNRNVGSFSSGGSPSEGPPHVSEITFSKNVDKASAKLQAALLQNTILATAKITIDKQDGQGGKVGFVTYDLEKVIVSSYSVGAGSGSSPVESVSLAFAKIVYTYTSTSTDTGGAEGQLTAGWDLQLNKPV